MVVVPEVVEVVVVVVVAEVVVVPLGLGLVRGDLAAPRINFMKGVVLIGVCRRNYTNSVSVFFKPAEMVCTRRMLIFPALRD